MHIACVDLFCGVGGLTYGLKKAGIDVRAGVELDDQCRWSYEANTGVRFVNEDVEKLHVSTLRNLLAGADVKLLAGCAPCQPFSAYGNTRKKQVDQWRLLSAFSGAVSELRPEFVTMENVPGLARHDVFQAFVAGLQREGYKVAWGVVACHDFGLPQFRKRLVLVASRLGNVGLPEPIRGPSSTVRDAIHELPPLLAGASHPEDPLHKAASLSELNLRRIRHSVPGGSWRSWPKELISQCHRADTGASYPSVYGRMEWDKAAPTITTQCYGYGSGRFGHPFQDRAISLREAALLQSFPRWWQFVPPGRRVDLAPVGRAIGNAVPPRLGEVIGDTVRSLALGKEISVASAA